MLLHRINEALNEAAKDRRRVVGIYLSNDAAYELREFLPEIIFGRALTIDHMTGYEPPRLFGYYAVPMMQSFFKEPQELFRLAYAD